MDMFQLGQDGGVVIGKFLGVRRKPPQASLYRISW